MKYLLIDTREKPRAIEAITKTFDAAGITYERTKLLIGDYMDFQRPETIIDRKQSILELAQNCTRDHVRFRAELERAKKAGAKLVILVEQNRYKDGNEWRHVEDIADLMRWSNEHTSIRGEKVYRVLASWRSKYGIEVVFCDKRSTGKRILQIIYGEQYVRKYCNYGKNR